MTSSSLADQHKADQSNLTRLLTAEMAPLLVPQPGRVTLGELVRALAALVGQYHRASAATAADYYDAARAQAHPSGRFTVPVIDPPPAEQLDRSLGWATRDLVDPVDLDVVVSRAQGSATRLALAGGRETLATAATRDPACRGYVRVARPGACWWCALLAIRVVDADGSARGVYTSRETAQRRGRNQDQDRYHDGCQCSVQAVFRDGDYEPPEHVQDWARIYADSTGDVTGAQKMTAFRAALSEQRGEHAH